MSARGHISYRVRAEAKDGSKRVKQASGTQKLDTVEAGPDAPIGFVRMGAGMTLSRGFNSVRVDVGVELPWAMRPGHAGDVNSGIEFATNLVSKSLAARTADIDSLLDDLSSEKR